MCPDQRAPALGGLWEERERGHREIDFLVGGDPLAAPNHYTAFTLQVKLKLCAGHAPAPRPAPRGNDRSPPACRPCRRRRKRRATRLGKKWGPFPEPCHRKASPYSAPPARTAIACRKAPPARPVSTARAPQAAFAPVPHRSSPSRNTTGQGRAATHGRASMHRLRAFFTDRGNLVHCWSFGCAKQSWPLAAATVPVIGSWPSRPPYGTTEHRILGGTPRRL
jgi:hypothetical protein